MRRVRCQAAMGRVRAHLIVVEAPPFDHGAGLGQAGEHLLVQALVADLPMKLSTKAFWVGLPGAM
jgi:hypothetical protein